MLGKVGDHFASKWEDKNRLNRVRWMTVDGYRNGQAPSFTDADWATLGAGRALLLVHGTFSTAHGGFGHLPQETMAELHDRYDGRVAAFDHHSISVSPKENADLLAGLVPDGDRRRARRRDPLAGRPGRSRDRGAGALDVAGLVMVAAPNAGTVLADRRHLSDLLDRFTDLAQFVPDNGVTDTLGLIFAVVKQAAVGAVGGLDGLTSMDPTGDYIKELNARPAPAAALRAVAADYEPPQGAPLARVARDGATDLVFAAADNDLVVPTLGCYDVPGSDGFPIDEQLVFEASRAIDHNSYFGQAELAQQLLDWLPPT